MYLVGVFIGSHGFPGQNCWRPRDSVATTNVVLRCAVTTPYACLPDHVMGGSDIFISNILSLRTDYGTFCTIMSFVQGI